MRNGYTYDEASAVCVEFANDELGKYRNDFDSYGHFPPPPQLICEPDGNMTLMAYDSNGNPTGRSYNPTKSIGLGIASTGNNSIGSIIVGFLRDILQREGDVPNRLTLYMGERVRTFRIEEGLSQDGLAEKTYLSRGELQAIEEGNVEITVSTLVYFAIALNKPIISFFPPHVVQNLDPQYMTIDEMELLMILHEFPYEEKKLIFKQIRS